MSQSKPTSVYKYTDDYGVLIYVGITNRGMRRQREHNQSKDWWPYVASQTVEHYETREDALSREESLIVAHRPPFNVQHNPNHDVAAQSYLQFRGLPGLDRTPLEIVREADQRIPLMVLEHHGSRLIMATPVKYAPAIASIDVAKPTPMLADTTRCGQLLEAVSRGPSLEITCDVRKGVAIQDPFLRVSIINTKAGAFFKTKNVQINRAA